MVDFRARLGWALWCVVIAGATVAWTAGAFDGTGRPPSSVAAALWASPAALVLLVTWWRGFQGLLSAALGVAAGATLHTRVAHDAAGFDLRSWMVVGGAMVGVYAAAGLWLRRVDADLGQPGMRDVVRFVVVAVVLAPVLAGSAVAVHLLWGAPARDQIEAARALATIDMSSIVVFVPVAVVVRELVLRRRASRGPRTRGHIRARSTLTALAAVTLIAAGVATASIAGVRADVIVCGLFVLGFAAIAEEHHRGDARARAATAELEFGGAQLRSMMEAMPDGVLVLDALGRVEAANAGAARIFGAEHHELTGMPLLALLPPPEGLDPSAHLVEALSSQRGATGTGRAWDARTLDGRPCSLEVSVSRVGSAQRWGYVATVREYVDHRRREQQLAHRAIHDELTQLPSRLLFQDRLEQALAGLRGRSTGVALLLIDVDHDEIDRLLGGFVGERILVEVADRVRGHVRAVDTVARVGDRELAVLCTSCPEPSVANELAQRLVELLASPHDRLPPGLAPRSHIGVVVTSDPDARPDHLFAAADIALDRARRAGNQRWAMYVPTIDVRERPPGDPIGARPHAIDLRDAFGPGDERLSSDNLFTSDNVVVRYQPILDLETGQATWIEALARLRGDDGLLLSPAQFVPQAERGGLIEQLSAVLLPRALEDLIVVRNEEDQPDLCVTVNISPRQLTYATIDLVADSLRNASLPGASLMLEITEAGPLEPAGEALDVVRRLRAMDVAVALDDFGRGFSRLDLVRELPLDALKIDKSLVHRSVEPALDRDVVELAVAVGRRRGLLVIAEGVETIEQVDAIARLGCTHAQGFLFGQPTDIEELRYLLREWQIVPAIASHPVRPAKDRGPSPAR